MADLFDARLKMRLQESGGNSGQWGTLLNQTVTNIASVFGFGTHQLTSDANATLTLSDDGASIDALKSSYLKITSSVSLTATRTLTFAPNTFNQVKYIENATTGSQSLVIKQGSGATVTVASGKTAVLYFTGSGSGAAVVDALAGVDPGVTDTLAEVLAAGNATGGTDIAVGTGDDVTFADSSKAIFGAGSDLQIYHDGSNNVINQQNNHSLRIAFAGGNQWEFHQSGLFKGNDGKKVILGNSSDLQLYHDGSNSYIDNTTGFLNFRTGGSPTTAMTIDSSQRVGIGTTPSEVLHVVDSNPTLTVSSSSVDQAVRLELYEQKNGSADLGGFFEYSGASANALLIGTTLNNTDTTHLYLPRDGSGSVQARRARSNTAGAVALSVQPSDSTIHYGFRIDSSTNSFNLDRVDSAAQLLTVSSTGNVGIGTSNPQALIDLTVSQAKTSTGGAAFAQLGKTNESSGYAALQCEVKGGASAADRKWTFQTIEQGVANAGSIVFQPDGGDAFIGTTINMGGRLNVERADGIAIGNADDQTYYRRIYGAGTGASMELKFWNGVNEGVLNSSGAWVDASDVSLKENITDTSYGLSTVMSLQPRDYTMKQGGESQVGFVAQEVESVVPEVVTTSENPEGVEMKGIAYGQLTAVLTKAIQEQQTLIESLTDRIAALENN